MQVSPRDEIELKIRADESYMPVVLAFTEKTCQAMGLSDGDALALTLATEEIFAYLCQTAAAGSDVTARCSKGGYYVELELSFRSHDFDMRCFNITWSPACDLGDVPEETGRLIASRMVDRFGLQETEDGLKLTLTKEKSYPEPAPLTDLRPVSMKSFRIQAPQPEEVKLLVRMVEQVYVRHLWPPGFDRPGKVVDMIAARDWMCAIAVDQASHLGGGILWRWDGDKIVEFFGPYMFVSPENPMIAQRLIEHMLAAVSRTHVIGVLNRVPVRELPEDYFELLGGLTVLTDDGDPIELNAYYRLLDEDPGTSVWAHHSMEPFLSEQYARLCLPREIVPVQDEGESRSDHCVISAEFDRPRGWVVLRPIRFGDDAENIVNAHVAALTREHVPCIFFEMDLGKPWQCHYAPSLSAAGFEPRLILPYRGKSDVVVFQHKGRG